MPQLRLDHYASDMRALARAVTDMQGAYRVQRATSTKMVDVDLVGTNARVTILLQEGGLYVKGFRNAQGTFYFKGEGVGGNQLKFNCSYTAPGGIAIFASTASSEEAKASRTRKNIEEAIGTLASFAGGNDLALKVPLATVAFVVSEAIRFTNVYYHVCNACSRNEPFSFSELQNYVQNWKKLSNGEAVPDVEPNRVFTFHSVPDSGTTA